MVYLLITYIDGPGPVLGPFWDDEALKVAQRIREAGEDVVGIIFEEAK